MTLIRYYSKIVFGRWANLMSPDKAQKWMNITRIVYFFSATSLVIVGYKAKNQYEKEALESGKPIIQDHSDDHERLRRHNFPAGVIMEYRPGQGIKTIEFNKDEYYQQLEKEAFDRAKKAQEKAIAEGRELPKDAIKLVE